jgi:hypothetical protein
MTLNDFVYWVLVTFSAGLVVAYLMSMVWLWDNWVTKPGENSEERVSAADEDATE